MYCVCVLICLAVCSVCDFIDVHTISTTLRSEIPVCTLIVSLVRMTGSVTNSSGSASSFDSRRLVVGFDDAPAAVIIVTRPRTCHTGVSKLRHYAIVYDSMGCVGSCVHPLLKRRADVRGHNDHTSHLRCIFCINRLAFCIAERISTKAH